MVITAAAQGQSALTITNDGAFTAPTVDIVNQNGPALLLETVAGSGSALVAIGAAGAPGIDSDIDGDLLGIVGGVDADGIDAAALATDAVNKIADAHLDRVDAIDTGVTPRKAHRLEVAAAAGQVSGNPTTTVLLKNPAGSKVRVTATVDGDGNRSAITLTDLT